MKQLGNTIIIDGFVDNSNRPSVWSLRIVGGHLQDAMVLALHWGDEETATHRVVVSRTDLLAALKAVPLATPVPWSPANASA